MMPRIDAAALTAAALISAILIAAALTAAPLIDAVHRLARPHLIGAECICSDARIAWIETAFDL